MDRQARRLARQFDSMGRTLPALRAPLARLVAPGAWPVRLPADRREVIRLTDLTTASADTRSEPWPHIL